VKLGTYTVDFGGKWDMNAGLEWQDQVEESGVWDLSRGIGGQMGSQTLS